jgi:hypothetical protein
VATMSNENPTTNQNSNSNQNPNSNSNQNPDSNLDNPGENTDKKCPEGSGC